MRFCGQDPDKNYLPWNPLAEYLGTGKFYHYEYMMECRSALVTLSGEEFRRHLPPGTAYVGLPAIATGSTNVLSTYLGPLTPCAAPGNGPGPLQWFSVGKQP